MHTDHTAQRSDGGRLLTHPTPRDQAMIDVARARRLGQLSDAERCHQLATIIRHGGRR